MDCYISETTMHWHIGSLCLAQYLLIRDTVNDFRMIQNMRSLSNFQIMEFLIVVSSSDAGTAVTKLQLHLTDINTLTHGFIIISLLILCFIHYHSNCSLHRSFGVQKSPIFAAIFVSINCTRNSQCNFKRKQALHFLLWLNANYATEEGIHIFKNDLPKPKR